MTKLRKEFKIDAGHHKERHHTYGMHINRSHVKSVHSLNIPQVSVFVAKAPAASEAPKARLLASKLHLDEDETQKASPLHFRHAANRTYCIKIIP